MKDSMNVIGLMSGTSVDGLDLCYVSFFKKNLKNFKIIKCETIDYPKNIKDKLLNIINYNKKLICEIDLELGKFIGFSVKDFLEKYNLNSPDLLSSHGHTVFHEPEIGKTLQIGNGKIIFDITGIKTINNFRQQDVKLKGQGAPLVPIGDKLLFDEYKYCLNLGGFVNISIKDGNQIYAYDICALNTVLNFYSKKIGYECDLNGKLSKKGKVDDILYNELNSLSFYKKKYPKSLGLEFVKQKIFPIINAYQISEFDILATYIKHAAFQIAKNISDKKKLLVSGGGSYNTTLIKNLKEIFDINVYVPNDTIVNFKESLIFALLGYLKINNQINCLSSVTGAVKDHSSGDIYF